MRLVFDKIFVSKHGKMFGNGVKFEAELML